MPLNVLLAGGAEATITDDQKGELLAFLRRAHGRTEEDTASAGPRKITLKRKTQSEIKVNAAQGRARTVSVEVRTKKTYINRGVLEEQARAAQEEIDRVREAEEAAQRAIEAEKQRIADQEAAKLAEEERAVPLQGDLLGGDEDAHGDGKVVGGAFFFEVGGGEGRDLPVFGARHLFVACASARYRRHPVGI